MQKKLLRNHSRFSHRLRPIVLALATAGLMGTAQAGPLDGVVKAGSATISGNGAYTRIDQSTGRAIIDWRSFSIGSGEQVQFVQPSASASILNRVTGSQVSTLLGRLDANGQVLLINPNGIVIGKSGQINVGSFIASTSNISNNNFMEGRLIFDQPGKAGAGILNAGSITAAEGGLVALVAPHVRNDGLIQARLGKVMLGAADTFTIDLYGDQLVNLALSDSHVGQLFDANGQPVQSLITQAGRIEAGQAVLVTASTARNVLDNLINMSGTIKAQTAVQDGGRIVLLGEGGTVAVSGTLEASGNRGGQVDVLGQNVNLAATANLNTDGPNGGGTIHVGGAYQGGSVYRSQNTTVEAGANLTANATTRGNGGEVVVWSDGHTSFAGNVEAKGGALSGDGGRLEVSGKGTLAFAGTADASAAKGISGSLLLDPAFLTIGATEAGQINQVLRTGTSTTLQADVDINVNSVIDGRSNIAGGGLTMTAGNNISVNEFIVTNNGALNLTAGNTVNIAPTKAIIAGSAPINVTAGGNLTTGPYVTTGLLSLASLGGAVTINSSIAGNTGPVSISAATDVNINQPIVNMATGSSLNVTAGNDIFVSAQLDGRGGGAGGAVNLTANRNISINDFIVTNNGNINVKATTGFAAIAAGKGLFAGNAPISLIAANTVSTGTMITTGLLNVTSTAGSINIDTPVDATIGAATFTAAGAVNVNQGITNTRSDSPLTIKAGTNITVNAQIDGRDANAGSPSGAVNLTAANNIVLNQSVITEDATINATATNGTYTTANVGTGLFAGTGSISLTTGSLLTLGNAGAFSTTGLLTLGSTNSSVNLNAPLTTLLSGGNVVVNAGVDINVNTQIEGRGGTAAGGGLIMTAGNNVNVNDHISTNNGTVNLKATNGSVNMAAGKRIDAGSGAITLTSKGDFYNGVAPTPIPDPGVPTTYSLGDPADPYYLGQYATLRTSGLINITSTNGNIYIRAPLLTPGAISISAPSGGIEATQPIHAIGQNITLTSGAGGISVPAFDLVAMGCTGNVTCFGGGPRINSGNATMTLQSSGNISADGGLAGLATININAGGTFSGVIRRSFSAGSELPTVTINAVGGIPTLDYRGGHLTATSSQGSITVDVQNAESVNLNASCATCDVFLPNNDQRMGEGLTVNAGRNIVLSGIVGARETTLNASNDIIVSGKLSGGVPVSLTAGRDITLTNSAVIRTQIDPATDLLNGAATFTAGRHFTSTGEISAGSASINAGQNLSLDRLITIGNVDLTATNGSATISKFVGAFYPLGGPNNVNPLNLGVASLTVNASGPIDLLGARAEGNITISSGTSVHVAGSLSSTLGPAAIQVTPTPTIDGGLVLLTGVQPTFIPFFNNGGGAGPTIPPPSALGLAAVNAPGTPSAFPEIVVAGAPGAALAGILTLPPTGAGDGGSVDTTAAQRASQSQSGSSESSGEGSPVVVADGGVVVLGGRVTTQQDEKVACPPGVASGSSIVTKNAAGREQSVVCK